MSTYIYFAVLGLSSGAIYVGLATGVQAVYLASGVINFAQGAVAMWGAYVFVELRTSGQLVLPIGSIGLGSHVPLVVDILLGLISAVVVAALAHFLVFRPMKRSPILARVVASVALLVTLEALAELRFGGSSVTVPPILPSGSIRFQGHLLPEADLILGGVAVVVAVGLWWWFRYTTMGVATRGGAANPDGISLLGYSPNRLGAVAWVMAAVVSSFIVMMASNASGLDPTTYTLDIVPALAVLLLARLSSLGIITIAGLGLGMFQSVISLLMSKPWWPTWAQSGVQVAIPFVIIVIVLFFTNHGLVSRGDEDAAQLPHVRIPKLRLRTALPALALGVVALLVTSGTYRYGVETSMVLALVALSYVIITGYVGQISLAQISFAGAAGFMLSKVTTSWHVPFPGDLLFSSLVAAALGLVMAVPAFRMRGAQLAIVTIAAAVAIQDFVFANPSLTPVAGNPIGEPRLFGFDLSVRSGSDISTLQFGILVLVIVALVLVLFVVLARGATGRSFLAVRSNERAAGAAGLNVTAVKLVAFGLSAFIAGVAGCLIGYSRGQLSVDSFTVFVGLELLAVAYLGGITSVTGAFLAGLLGPLGVVYVFLNSTLNLGQYYSLVAGLGLLVTAVLNQEGMAGKVRTEYERIRSKRRRQELAPAPVVESAPTDVEASHVS